jgi:hypothetical protein
MGVSQASGADQRTTDLRRNTTDVSRGQLERLTRFFERLTGNAFFGKVVVSFQNGKVADVKIEQTKKLEEL